MENLNIILSISGTALGLLITTITFFSQFIKSVKAKKFTENITKIGNVILPYIEEAETFLNFTGEEKKQYVMTKANQYAIENGIKFDAAAVNAKIEELVSLTKKVNTSGKHANSSATENGLPIKSI